LLQNGSSTFARFDPLQCPVFLHPLTTGFYWGEILLFRCLRLLSPKKAELYCSIPLRRPFLLPFSALSCRGGAAFVLYRFPPPQFQLFFSVSFLYCQEFFRLLCAHPCRFDQVLSSCRAVITVHGPQMTSIAFFFPSRSFFAGGWFILPLAPVLGYTPLCDLVLSIS